MRPLNVLSRTGVNVTRLRPAHAFSALSIADIEQAITCETKMLVITHASNVTGVLQPVLEYGALARRHGLIFLVDAAQTAGKYPIDVGESNIDLLALAGHKGLMGPTGTGALYISQRVDLNTWREGGTGSHSELEKQPGDFPDRYESGTLNGAGICGLGAGLKFILGEGLWSIQSHEQDLTFRLVSGLRNIKGIKLYVDSNNGGQIPVVSFNIEGYDPAEIGFILDNTFNIKVRTGLHCAPGVHRLIGAYPQGTVRFSPGYFNTLGEMDEAVAAVARIARARGHQRKGMKRSPVSNIPVN
jgi:selenocysteine lyase/cysteine desulfurase